MRVVLLSLFLVLITFGKCLGQPVKLGISKGHTSAVTSVQFSRDDRLLITTGNQTKVWDVQSGRLLYNLDGHNDVVLSANFSPDGNSIVTTSKDQTAKVWDARSGCLKFSLNGHTDVVSSAQYSSDGNMILTSSWDKNVMFWDSSCGKLLYKLNVFYKIKLICFSPNGKTFVTIPQDERLWEKRRNDSLDSLMGFQDGKPYNSIWRLSENNKIKAWSSETSEHLYSLEGKLPIYSIQYSSDGHSLLTTALNSTCIWDSKDGHLRRRFGASLTPSQRISQFGSINKVRVIQEGDANRVMLVLDNRTTVKLFDSRTFQQISILANDEPITSCQLSPNGKQVLTTSKDKLLRIWDVQSGKLFQILRGHRAQIVISKFSYNGRLITSASKDGEIMIWNTDDGKLINVLNETSSTLLSGSLIPKSRWILIRNLGGSKIWNLENGLTSEHLNKYLTLDHSLFFNPNGKNMLVVDSNGSVKLVDVLTGGKISTLSECFSCLPFVSFNPNGESVALSCVSDAIEFSADGKIMASSHDNFKASIWSTDNGEFLFEINSHVAPRTIGVRIRDQSNGTHRILSRKDDYSDDVTSKINNRIARSGSSVVRVWSSRNGEFLCNLKEVHDKILKIQFVTNDRHLLTISEDFIAKLWSINTGEEVRRFGKRTSTVHEVFYQPSLTSNDEVIATRNGYVDYVKIYSLKTGKFRCRLGHKNLEGICLGYDGKYAMTFSRSSVALWSIQKKKQLIKVFPRNTSRLSPIFTPNGRAILVGTSDKTQLLFTINQEMEAALVGHNAKINSASFGHCSLENGQQKYLMLTSSADGSFIVRDVDSGKLLYRSFLFDHQRAIHVGNQGYFDADPELTKEMYWTKGLEVIEFEQLKNRYWVPGLVEKIMNGEPLPNVKNMDELKLYPEVEVHEVQDGKLVIDLQKREGGYGKVAVYINGKEMSQDVRGAGFDTTFPNQHLSIDVGGHPFLEPGDNILTVKVSSADGSIQSRGIEVMYHHEVPDAQKAPQFFGVMIGVGHYNNPAINLKYTEADTRSMAKAVALGAQSLFGKERTFMYTLSTAEGQRPDKEAIRATFNEISQKARVNDVLMVYLSGHGITWGGEQGEFYYLTADATASYPDAYNDAVLRKNHAISTKELADWLLQSPMRKQVLIIDACGSGKAVDNLLASRKVDAARIKAIDRMKDRTGMFILSGCAADAVSYEASPYGHGLLTYSLLQGMRGAALKDGRNLDVSTWFNHARDRVPELAKGIGGIQLPQLLIPRSGSFEIGLMSDSSKSAMDSLSEMQVYVRSQFQDDDVLDDHLGLSEALDAALNTLSVNEGNNSIVVVDTRFYPGACRFRGLYTQDAEGIHLRYKLHCGESIKEGEIAGENVDALVEQLVRMVKE